MNFNSNPENEARMWGQQSINKYKHLFSSLVKP